MISPLASPSSSKCEEGKQFMEEISEAIKCAKDIEEMTIPLLKRLWKRIFRRRAKVATKRSVTTQKLMEI
jgi:hypothetical protein